MDYDPVKIACELDRQGSADFLDDLALWNSTGNDDPAITLAYARMMDRRNGFMILCKKCGREIYSGDRKTRRVCDECKAKTQNKAKERFRKKEKAFPKSKLDAFADLKICFC